MDEQSVSIYIYICTQFAKGWYSGHSGHLVIDYNTYNIKGIWQTERSFYQNKHKLFYPLTSIRYKRHQMSTVVHSYVSNDTNIASIIHASGYFDSIYPRLIYFDSFNFLEMMAVAHINPLTTNAGYTVAHINPLTTNAG